jgi:hypothetical protein
MCATPSGFLALPPSCSPITHPPAPAAAERAAAGGGAGQGGVRVGEAGRRAAGAGTRAAGPPADRPARPFSRCAAAAAGRRAHAPAHAPPPPPPPAPGPLSRAARPAQLQSGAAEIFGAELSLGQRVPLAGHAVAVFTWEGATLLVEGDPDMA